MQERGLTYISITALVSYYLGRIQQYYWRSQYSELDANIA